MISNQNLIMLSQKQSVLDLSIEKKANINPASHFKHKLIAFLVELSEFLNETKFFKYWSVKPPNPKAVQLEEYVDGLHFIISIGNEIHYNFETFTNTNDFLVELRNDDFILQFVSAFNNFVKDSNIDNYAELLVFFITLGDRFEFLEQEIIAAYELKNQQNFERIENNY